MSSPGAAPERDRTLRLVVFGALATALGGVALFLAGFQLLLLLPGMSSMLGPGVEMAGEPLRLVMGAVTWALVGLAFGALGVGSIRRRRWVRPLMLTLAWSWLLGGVISMLLLPGLLDLSLASSGLETTGPLSAIVRGMMLVGAFVFGVLLPAAFVWAYRDPAMQRTCERYDLRPAWTEQGPPAVLGLAVALAACALLFVPMALHPAVPFFGTLMTGAAGSILTLLTAALCGALAVGVHRLRLWGWWGTTALLVLIGVSTLITQWRAPAEAWAAALGYEAPVSMLEDTGAFRSPLALAATVVVTVASVIYLVRLRRHFEARSAA